jgi:hypothetical protein
VSAPEPQRYVPFELPQQLVPQPFACLTQGHHAQQAGEQALSHMLRAYEKKARAVRKNRVAA